MHEGLAKLLSPVLHLTGSYRRLWRGPTYRRAGLVLMYHRIAARQGVGEPAGYGVEQGLPVDVFEAQLRFLLRYFEPARAAEIALGEPGADRARFAISFDDGYADNLALAAPVLERLGVPAILFVNTGMVGTDRRFWWESLGAMLREARCERIEVGSLGPALAGRWPLPPTLPLQADADRARAHWLLSMGLMRTPHAEIDAVLEALGAVLEVPLRREGRDAPLLDWAQLREWRERGFDVGGHGAGHANLGLSDAAEARREIAHSFERIADELGSPPELFAYPYGGREHRSPAAVDALRKAGFRAAFTTELGAVRPEHDRYALPRLGYTRAARFVCAHQTQMAFQASAPAREMA